MIYEVIIVILIGIDQIIKHMVLEKLKIAGSVPVINGVFHLTYVENRGAAFGMLQNKQYILAVIAVIAIIIGLYYFHKNKNSLGSLGRTSIIMIISGAVGNLIDRIRLGFVVDYFDFRIIWQYVFNFADVLIVCGTILLCLHVILYDSYYKQED